MSYFTKSEDAESAVENIYEIELILSGIKAGKLLKSS